MAAKNTIPMLVDLYRNKMTTSKCYGMIFGRVFSRDGLNLKGFAKHLSHHGKLATYEMMVLVLQNIVDCMKELLLQGVPVKLDGLGTFSPGVTSLPADTIEEYDPQTMITGVKINFQPEAAGYDEDKLTRKQLLSETTLELNDYIEIHDKVVDGKRVTYQERTPVRQLKIKNAEADPEPEP